MCDTFVALRNATRDGSVIFGKNSDRDPNEAHELLIIPHAKHPEGSSVGCTYIKIPQVQETNAILLAKPFWIWGGEMGANEHGVVIGNEAVFTKVPYEKEPGLIGMDFLRLALERARSAVEALDVMIDLLEQYGQGGNCGFAHDMFYHNGFLIADREEAWVFETAGKHWAAKQVHDVASISNVISISSSWDRASDDLVSHAISKGWCKNESDFNFSQCYSDFIYTTFAAGKQRLCRTNNCLEGNIGQIDVPFAMDLLRDHGAAAEAGETWQPGRGLTGAEVCMHASFGPVRVSQTTGSMISHLTPEVDTHWLTGTSAPCTSIFKPVWIDAESLNLGPRPGGTYDEATMWWQHENLHRELLRDYSARIEVISAPRANLEREFLEKSVTIRRESLAIRKNFIGECFRKSQEMEMDWLNQIQNMPVGSKRPILDRLAWRNFDKAAQRPG